MPLKLLMGFVQHVLLSTLSVALSPSLSVASLALQPHCAGENEQDSEKDRGQKNKHAMLGNAARHTKASIVS